MHSRARRHRFGCNQRGIAPLEMVMSLPFLVGLTAMIYSLTTASLGRSTAAIEARAQVWRLREDPESADDELIGGFFHDTRPLSITTLFPVADGRSGLLSGEIHKTMRVYRGFGSTANCESGTALVVRTWDHKYRNKFKGKSPHFPVLTDMASFDLKATSQLDVFGDPKLDSLPGNPGAIDKLIQDEIKKMTIKMASGGVF